MVNKIKCGKCNEEKKVTEIGCGIVRCKGCKAFNYDTEELHKDHALQEWLGFNYKEFIDFIVSAIQQDSFDFQRATTPAELKAGRLSASKIDELKGILEGGFRKGESIKEISSKIERRVKPGDLFATEDGKLKLNAKGDKILRLSAQFRPLAMARSETTRMAAIGAEDNYKQSGLKQYSWVASIGNRTCPICEELNGQIFEVGGGTLPPAHGMCRCSIIPVVTG